MGEGGSPSVIAPVADPEKPSGACALLSVAVPKYNKKFKRLPFWTADDDFFCPFRPNFWKSGQNGRKSPAAGVKSSRFAGSAANKQAA